MLTPEAKIASDFFFIGAIFAVVGFVSALGRPGYTGRPLFARWTLAAGCVILFSGRMRGRVTNAGDRKILWDRHQDVFKPKEHEPSHIHALYGDYMGEFNVQTMEMMQGDLPPLE